MMHVLLFAAILGSGQQVSGASITGMVVDGVSGRPISAAVVSISGSGMTVNPLPNQAPQILTAADGRFVFRGLGAGAYAIRSTKGGYADGAPGRRRPGGDSQAIELGAGTNTADVVLRMWKDGAITGTVTDEAGEPVVGVTVRLLLRAKPGASPTPLANGSSFIAFASPYAAGVAGPTQTDDRGIYRFSGLAAGDYIVVAAPPPLSGTFAMVGAGDATQQQRFRSELLARSARGSTSAMRAVDLTAPLRIGDAYVNVSGSLLPPPVGGRVRLYPTTFYPAATSAPQASLVTLATAEERANVDIQLVPVPVAKVSGTVMAADGPATFVSVRLMPAGSEAFPADLVAATSITDGAGNFLFATVPPGHYRLKANVSRRELGIVDAPLDVAGDDIGGIVVTPRPPIKITATFQYDGTTQPPKIDLANSRGFIPGGPFVLDPVDATSGPDSLELMAGSGENRFIAVGYPPGRYRVRVTNSPSGWMFKAAMLNGVDVSESPFELSRDVPDLSIVFTDRWTGLNGSVGGQGADGATVLAFPADASKWTGDGFAPRRFKTARANARGEFGMSSLPAGDYYVVAVPEEQTDGWRDPATLDALSRVATQITILDGESKRIDLPIRQVRQ
jgi:hypothetical protein